MNVLVLVPVAPTAVPTAVPLQVADTVLALPGRDGFDMIFGVTAGIIGLTFLAILLGLLFLVLQARKITGAIGEARRRVGQDRGIEHLRRTAENVEKLSRTIRKEVEALEGTSDEFSERLVQVSDRLEERIEEFNAFIEVIQDEAEEVFLDTASTARGVRRSLGMIRDGRRAGSRRGRRSAAGPGGRGGRTAPSAAPDPRPPATPEDEPGDRLDTQVTSPPTRGPDPSAGGDTPGAARDAEPDS